MASLAATIATIEAQIKRIGEEADEHVPLSMRMRHWDRRLIKNHTVPQGEQAHRIEIVLIPQGKYLPADNSGAWRPGDDGFRLHVIDGVPGLCALVDAPPQQLPDPVAEEVPVEIVVTDKQANAVHQQRSHESSIVDQIESINRYRAEQARKAAGGSIKALTATIIGQAREKRERLTATTAWEWTP